MIGVQPVRVYIGWWQDSWGCAADYLKVLHLFIRKRRSRLDSGTWPGTGRLIQVDLGALTRCEINGGDLRRPAFLARIASDRAAGLGVPGESPDLRDYLEMAIQGGFPEVIGRTERGRMPWLMSYLDQLFTRDVDQLDGRRDPGRLRRFFEAYVVNTAGVVPLTTLHEVAQIDRKTADAYEGLLRDLFVIDTVPAWSTNRASPHPDGVFRGWLARGRCP